jgi:DNA-nicking Smr family endonuclease
VSSRFSPEDRELWERVKGSVTPMHPRQAIPAPPPKLAPVSASNPAPAPPLHVAVAPFRIGQGVDHRRTNDLLPGLAESLASVPLRMDAGTFGKMRKGKLRPEARIDLHGMTVAEAHPALRSFILGSRAKGRRLVLVITGKGRVADDFAPMPVRAGRLRHDVPRWLALPPLAGAVLQIAPAHQRHGGEGALYVYLRA